MKFVAAIFSARLWFAVMLSLTMNFGAFAADIHPADAEEIACQSAEINAHSNDLVPVNNSDQDQDNRPEHDHHAHNCGSCHVHIFSTKLSGFTIGIAATLSLKPGRDQAAPRAGPLGLYRPPRA